MCFVLLAAVALTFDWDGSLAETKRAPEGWRRTGGTTLIMGFKRAFVPIISLLFLWLISSPGLAVKIAAAGEQDSPDASASVQPSSRSTPIVPLIPPVKMVPGKGVTVPPEYLEKWQNQMRYNAAHGIPNQTPEVQWSGPMGHAPRLPNGMLGWEFDGIYTSFGCQPDPIGWIDGIPVFRDGKHTY